MFLHLQLLQITWLLLDSGNSAAATTLWHILSWTPQLLWGLCANGLLIGLVLNRRRIHNIWGVLWLPAAMILGSILIIRFLCGMPPFEELRITHYPEEYADTVLPSMWMLAGLGLLYGWTILLLWYDTRQQAPRYEE